MPDEPPDVDLYADWSDHQLVTQATRRSGAGGAGPAAEVNRRLMDRIVKAADSADSQTGALNRLTRWLVVFTVAIFILTGVLVAIELGYIGR